MNTKKLPALLILTAADIAALFGAYQLFSYLRDDYWFLRHENQPVLRFLLVAGIIAAFIVIIAVNIIILRKCFSAKQVPAAPSVQIPAQNAVDNFTAADYIKIFQEVKVAKPNLTPLIEDALNQLDTFYDDKEAIDRIMRIQNISYTPVLHAIEQSEKNLLKTMKSLLVDISAWNPKRLTDETRKTAYEEVYQSIQSKLAINKKNLQSFHDLLMRVRTLKTEEVAEDNTIQALVKALESTKL